MESRGGRESPPTFAPTAVRRVFNTGRGAGSTPDLSKVGSPSNEAQQLTANRVYQLRFGSIPASTLGASATVGSALGGS